MVVGSDHQYDILVVDISIFWFIMIISSIWCIMYYQPWNLDLNNSMFVVTGTRKSCSSTMLEMARVTGGRSVTPFPKRRPWDMPIWWSSMELLPWKPTLFKLFKRFFSTLGKPAIWGFGFMKKHRYLSCRWLCPCDCCDHNVLDVCYHHAINYKCRYGKPTMVSSHVLSHHILGLVSWMHIVPLMLRHFSVESFPCLLAALWGCITSNRTSNQWY